MTLYRIYWESTYKNRTGSGSKGFPREEALLTVEELNADAFSNYIKYRIQEEGSDTDGKLYENGVEVFE